MLIGTENSHLRKYLTTLGVSIVAASIAFAGFFFRSQGDLLVESETISKLTPSARRTLERRQAYLELAAGALPWVLLVCISVGLFLAAWGIAGWAARQSVIDQKDDAERDRSTLEVRMLSRGEEAARRTREVVEDSELEARTLVRGRMAILPASLGSALPLDRTSRKEGDVASRVHIHELVETKLIGALSGALHAPVDRNVRIRSHGRTAAFDAIVRPGLGSPNLIVEVGVLFGGPAATKNLSNRLHSGIMRLVEGIGLLAVDGGEHRGLLFLVCEDLDAVIRAGVQSRTDVLLEAVNHPIDVVVMDSQTALSISDSELASRLGWLKQEDSRSSSRAQTST